MATSSRLLVFVMRRPSVPDHMARSPIPRKCLQGPLSLRAYPSTTIVAPVREGQFLGIRILSRATVARRAGARIEILRLERQQQPGQVAPLSGSAYRNRS
jgi:hypothetical protein